MTTTENTPKQNSDWWLGYMVATVRQAARDGNPAAMASLNEWCDESGMATSLDFAAVEAMYWVDGKVPS